MTGRPRQRDEHGRAFANVAFDVEAAAMSADDMLDDGETEPGSADRSASAGVDPVESLGQARQMLDRNALAAVDDGKAKLGRPVILQAHRHLRIDPSIFESVDDQVADELEQLPPVA